MESGAGDCRCLNGKRSAEIEKHWFLVEKQRDLARWIDRGKAGGGPRYVHGGGGGGANGANVPALGFGILHFLIAMAGEGFQAPPPPQKKGYVTETMFHS